MKFIIAHLVTLQMLHINLVKIGPEVLEKKMLKDNPHRNLHDEGRQSVAIGHLSHSGDLKLT